MTDKRDSLRIVHNSHTKTVHGTFASLDFENDGYHVIYIPSLKLSSYGKTKDEANKMMGDIVLKDFCEHLMEQPFNKVISDLKALGFKQKGFFKGELCKSAHIDKEGILRDFDLAEDTKMIEGLVTV